MSMQVYQMAVMAEHGLATKPRWSAREQRTRRGSIGNRVAMACGIAALALTLGFAFVADEAAAWSGTGRGLAISAGRATVQSSTVHQRQATAKPRYGGGALATRR
jgi:hypothetical protein